MSMSRSSYSFFTEEQNRRQNKLRVQKFASYSRYWQEPLKNYELTYYPGHDWTLTPQLLLLPRGVFKTTIWPQSHRRPYQSNSPPYNSSPWKYTQSILAGNGGEQPWATGLSCWEGAQVVRGFWSLTQFFSGSPQFENKCHKHREDRGMNHWRSSHSMICQHRKRQTQLPFFPTHWDLLRQCLEKCWPLKFARASVILETISRLFSTGRGIQLKLI